MNEKERILDLVKKGVISSQEAISLLEELGKNQGESSKVSEQEKKMQLLTKKKMKNDSIQF